MCVILNAHYESRLAMDHDKVLVVLMYTPVAACDRCRAEAGCAVPIKCYPSSED